MDKERFDVACDKVIGRQRERSGIGTLGEKTIHAVLKYYYEPYEDNHETKIGGYVADIVGENGIIEVQTANFNKLRKKLEAFLSVTGVTVVYPVARVKWLVWLDNETGEASPKRKSPKTGRRYEVLPELYRMKSLLLHPNLHICVVMLDVEEYRRLDGWSSDRKKGSTRYERIPVGAGEEVEIAGVWDYDKLIPPSLPQSFTVKDYRAATKLSPHKAGTAINVLRHVGAVECVGKQGNAFVYRAARQAADCAPPLQE